MAATANLKLFVNWYTRTLQISDTNSGAFALPGFRKYETIPFEVVIVEPDNAAIGFSRFARVDISALSLSIAINEAYDDATPLCYQATFSKDEDTNTFKGELAMNTAGMNAYIGSNDSKAAYFEIEMQEATARSKIFTASITVYNAVTQTATTVPTPSDEYYTKAQTDQQFVKEIQPAGRQQTYTSPANTYQRIIGVDDAGAPVDQILPV